MGMGSVGSSGGIPLIGGGKAGTPDSLTLSVDSLTQRQMYRHEEHKKNLQQSAIPPPSAATWQRTPIADISKSGGRRVDHPPQYPAQKVCNLDDNCHAILIMYLRRHSYFCRCIYLPNSWFFRGNFNSILHQQLPTFSHLAIPMKWLIN